MFGYLKLVRRVKDLEDMTLRLTRLVESRDLDWTDMRARVKRLLDRTEKAAARLESPETPSGADETVPSQEQFTGLTPHQSTLQKMILAKRRANGVLPSSG